jgi:hypothetical protein
MCTLCAWRHTMPAACCLSPPPSRLSHKYRPNNTQSWGHDRTLLRTIPPWHRGGGRMGEKFPPYWRKIPLPPPPVGSIKSGHLAEPQPVASSLLTNTRQPGTEGDRGLGRDKVAMGYREIKAWKLRERGHRDSTFRDVDKADRWGPRARKEFKRETKQREFTST